jgi:hypothetical protein
MRLQRITCIMLVVLLGACSGTARVPEKGRCVRADQLFPSHAALVARVDRALAGTDADRAAANVRLVSSSELRLTFPASSPSMQTPVTANRRHRSPAALFAKAA